MIVTFPAGRPLVKIIDFGIATILARAEITQTGELLGTPRYMSPEQCRGEQATAKSDQYSLGVVFYECLTRKAVFTADSAVAYIHLHQFENPPLPSSIIHSIEIKILDSMIMKMLAKNPEERFSNMEQFFDKLRKVLPVLKPIIDHDLFPFMNKITSRLEATSQLKTENPTDELPGQHDKTQDSGMNIPTHQKEMRILRLGDDPILHDDALALLETAGFSFAEQCFRPDNFPAQMQDYDYFVMALPQRGWLPVWKSWIAAGMPPARTLVVVDWLMNVPETQGQVKHFSNLLTSTLPVEAMPLGVSLSIMASHSPLDYLASFSEHERGSLDILSSAEKSTYLDQLIHALETQGIRQSVQTVVRKIADEMVMNAIYNAPVDAQGHFLYRDRERSQTITALPL